MRGDRFSLCADQHPYRRCCGNGRWLAAYGTGDSAVPRRIFFNTFYILHIQGLPHPDPDGLFSAEYILSEAETVL